MESLHSRFAHLLNELPEQPTPEEWERGQEAINQLVTDFSLMREAMTEHGVGDIMNQYFFAMDAGEPVPEDIRREITNFHEAQAEVIGELIPMAVRWARREDETNQLAAELEQLLAQLEQAPE